MYCKKSQKQKSKQNTMKHLKHLFTALLLLCTTVATAHDFEVDGIYYDITDTTNKTVKVTYRGTYNYSYSNEYTGSVVIPESVTYNGTTYSITRIGEYVFEDCTGLTSITIPNSITSIGDAAFRGCTSLKDLHIADSEGTLFLGYNDRNNGIFDDCPLETLYLGRDLSYDTSIYGYSPFHYKSTLTSATIGNSVTTIGDAAFYGCSSLTSIVIPNNVTRIGNYAFRDCYGLTSIEFNAENCTSMGSDGYPVFGDCTALSTVTIGENVKNIPAYAFYDCTGLTSIVIPNSVTSIGNYAFRGCYGLTSIEFNAENCTSMGSDGYPVFGDCTALSTVTIGENVKNIPAYAFYNCDGLTSIEIPNSVTNIGSSAFYGCKALTSVVIGNSVTTIGNYAFRGCTGLTSIVIGNSVTTIGSNAFYNCSKLKTVINFSNLTFIKGSNNNGYVAYYADKVYNASNCSIVDDFIFVKPNNVNTLLYYLGNATELTLPADCKGENYVIGANVFKDNTTISSIVIPNSVTSIGEGAFSGCTGLEKVYINDLAAWCGIDFGSADANPLYYAKNLYLNGELLTELSIPAEIAEVKDYAFYNCNGVTNIDIVDGVKSIGNSAFYGCSDLETLYISNTIESIGDYAFAECNNIIDIKIGSKKAIAASKNIFSSDAYNNACLYVPTGRNFAYKKTAPWSNFYIVEMDFTGIDEVKAENGKVKTVYDLQGRKVENPTNGVYIINGKKVVIK